MLLGILPTLSSLRIQLDAYRGNRGSQTQVESLLDIETRGIVFLSNPAISESVQQLVREKHSPTKGWVATLSLFARGIMLQLVLDPAGPSTSKLAGLNTTRRHIRTRGQP